MIQYIRTKKNSGNIIGLLYADIVPDFTRRGNDKIVIGYSLLNKKDAEEIREYNNKVRRVNGESYHLINQGLIEESQGHLEKYRPIFDKQEALEVAINRATPLIDLNKVPQSLLKHFPYFFERVEKYFKGYKVAFIPKAEKKN